MAITKAPFHTSNPSNLSSEISSPHLQIRWAFTLFLQISSEILFSEQIEPLWFASHPKSWRVDHPTHNQVCFKKETKDASRIRKIDIWSINWRRRRKKRHGQSHKQENEQCDETLDGNLGLPYLDRRGRLVGLFKRSKGKLRSDCPVVRKIDGQFPGIDLRRFLRRQVTSISVFAVVLLWWYFFDTKVINKQGTKSYKVVSSFVKNYCPEQIPVLSQSGKNEPMPTMVEKTIGSGAVVNKFGVNLYGTRKNQSKGNMNIDLSDFLAKLSSNQKNIIQLLYVMYGSSYGTKWSFDVCYDEDMLSWLALRIACELEN